MFKKTIICTFLIITSLVFGYSEQVVVSKFDIGLKNSVDITPDSPKDESGNQYNPYKYSLTGVTTKGNIQSIEKLNKTLGNSVEDEDITLSDVTAFNFISKEKFDTGLEYKEATGQKAIIIPVDRNTDSIVKEGSFNLTDITGSGEDKVINYLIQEKFTLPAKCITLTSQNVLGGNKFTFSESSDIKRAHLEAYKSQNYMIRIVKTNSFGEEGTTNYDIETRQNGILEANIQNNSEENAIRFLEGKSNYVDFTFSGDIYDKELRYNSKNTMKATLDVRFKSGEIYIYGLPQRTAGYRIELYSFRYTKDSVSRGSVVITKEASLPFKSENLKIENSINLLGFSSKEFSTIKATILVISDTSSQDFKVKETYNSNTNLMTISNKNIIIPEELYILPDNGGTPQAIKIDDLTSGYDNETKKYYREYTFEYTTPNLKIDNLIRTVRFEFINDPSIFTETTYNVSVDVKPLIGEAYQTVYATFDTLPEWKMPLDINDRVMDRYTQGYKGIRVSNQGNIENLYRGQYGSNTELTSGTNDYKWNGTGSGKSVIINKIISDSKGSLVNKDGEEYFTFYTTKWTPNLKYQENEATSYDSAKKIVNSTDTANFSWDSLNSNSYVTVSQDKVIFRIVRLDSSKWLKTSTVSLEKYNDTKANTYPIGITGNESGSNKIEDIISGNIASYNSFQSGSKGYFDLIFKAGEDSQFYAGNAIFTFSKDNKLKIVGMDVGRYQLQIYSLQKKESTSTTGFDYKVLTYGQKTEFYMGLPAIIQNKFPVNNNFYFIDSISVGSDKKINAELVIKADGDIDLSKENLIARKDEISTTNSAINFYTKDDYVTERWNPSNTDYLDSKATGYKGYKNMKPVDPSVIKVEKSKKPNFQYPLDIVFLIDNSASMQNEIDAVNAGLDTFATNLTEKGYDVKFNLITFGAKQQSGQIGYYNDGVTGYPINQSYSGYKDIDFSKNESLAIFNKTNGWFTAPTGTDSKSVKSEEVKKLKNALSNLQGMGGAANGQENGSYALHYGIEQLKSNGRYLNKELKIVDAKASLDQQYLPSKKWLVFLTDENMDQENLPANNGYTATNLVNELSKKLASSDINLTGIYHTSYVSSVNNDNKYSSLNPTISKEAKEFWNFRNTFFEVKKDSKGYYIEYNRVGNYQYLATDTNGVNLLSPNVSLDTKKTYYIKDITLGTYIGGGQINPIVFDGNKYIYDFFGGKGSRPQDYREIFYTDFALQGLGSLYHMYDMGTNGELVTGALTDSVKDIGIVQRWVVSYPSPWTQYDGKKREAIFSLNGVKRAKVEGSTTPTTEIPLISCVTAESRLYTVPESKIEAYFSNPTSSKPKLIKKDGIINVEGKARSQYSKLDISVTPNVTKIYNYPITKGTFIITGYKSNDGVNKLNTNLLTYQVSNVQSEHETVSLSDYKEGNSTWYKAQCNINAKNFTDEFGKNPSELKIEFIAETEELSASDKVEGLTLVEGDKPKISSITGVNITLKDFMASLTSNSTEKIFNDTAVEKATGSKIISSDVNGIKSEDFKIEKNTDGTLRILNAKDGDVISLEFEIDDESITKDSKEVKANYNSGDIVATFVSRIGDEGSTKTKWKAEIIYKAENPDVTFNITDDSLLKNNLNLTGKAFNEPALLENTSFKPNLKANAESKYFSSALTTEMAKTDEILAYLVVFNYDKTIVDAGAPTSAYSKVGTLEWASSLNGEFKLGDGSYNYNNAGIVYVMNKAGAIKTITSSTVNMIENIIPKIGTGTKDFYVDTIAPVVTSPTFSKTKEFNEADFAGDTEILKTLLGTNKTFKVGDTISLGATVSDVNYFKSIVPNNIYTGTITYKKNGVKITTEDGNYSDVVLTQDMVAADLTNDENIDTTVISLAFYDKAGNETVVNIGKTYDDRVPKGIEAISKIKLSDSGNIKYTNDESIPLTSGDIPLSVGVLTSGNKNYFGALPAYKDYTGTDKNSLSNFTEYKPVKNIQNRFSLTVYSRSGMKGSIVEDEIVLDNSINYDGDIYETNAVKTNKLYQVDLNTALGKITELVGLNEFTISSSDAKDLSISLIKGQNGRYMLEGAPYSITKVAHNFAKSNKLQFSTTKKGNVSFALTVYDRLGNVGVYNYIVQIPNDITIIGKTNSSGKEIKTRIGVMDKVKISSRTEK